MQETVNNDDVFTYIQHWSSSSSSSNMSSSLFRGKITPNHYLHSGFCVKSHLFLISCYSRQYSRSNSKLSIWFHF